jgi:catechol 2,3-dioxygenase-like lactoylglutathione lyase family enzyme
MTPLASVPPLGVASNRRASSLVTDDGLVTGDLASARLGGMAIPLERLRTVIYPAPDLNAAKAWWTDLLGFGPYFDEPFYVGFEVGGYELGLLPTAELADGALTYWGTAHVEAAVAAAKAAGATEHTPASEVGDGIITATVRDPQGVIVGFIHNPHFGAG